MPFAISIPDWDSLDSVRYAHSHLELWAIAYFALLVVFDIWSHLADDRDHERARILEKIGLCCFGVAVVFEIAGYIYGERNDTLSERVIGSLDVKAESAFKKASDARDLAQNASDIAESAKQKADRAKDEAEAAERDISLAQKQLAQIQKFTQPRIIDMKSITEATKPYPGTAFTIRWFPDTDSNVLMQQLLTALVDAKWKMTIWQHISIEDAEFTEVYVDHANGLTGVPLPEPGCQALVKAMVANFVGPNMSNVTRHPKDPNLVVITLGTRGLEWVPPSEKIKTEILNRKPMNAQPPGVTILDPCTPNP